MRRPVRRHDGERLCFYLRHKRVFATSPSPSCEALALNKGICKMRFNALLAQRQNPIVQKKPAIVSSPGSVKHPASSVPQGLASMMGNRALSALVQAKLTIGAANDKYEQEADRVADQVMRMAQPHLQRQVEAPVMADDARAAQALQAKPLGPAITPRVQRQSDEEDEEAEGMAIQTKPASGRALSADCDVQGQIQSLKGGGQALAASERAFFEPRFGRDFGAVRIHTDSAAQQSAKSINARAYTLGADVVFGAGEYAPGSGAGRHLLAHELTHVVQQGHGPQASSKNNTHTTVQRKVKVNSGVNLNMHGYTHTKTGDVYSAPRVEKRSVYHEIWTSLLHSPRVFKIKGTTNRKANKNFSLHRATRARILAFAAKKKYTFGAGPAFKMNPKYWIVDATSWRLKPGANRKKAIRDLNINPTEYSIACQAATQLTMEGGGSNALVSNPSADHSDWVPGDWGYIKNTKFTGAPDDVGLEGENLIYAGMGKFWGHFAPGNTYKTLQEWFDSVEAWNGGALIKNTRKFPSDGLE